MTINETAPWFAAIPSDLGDQLRDGYRRGWIKPINALAELRMAKVPLEGIDELEVGAWLRLTS